MARVVPFGFLAQLQNNKLSTFKKSVLVMDFRHQRQKWHSVSQLKSVVEERDHKLNFSTLAIHFKIQGNLQQAKLQTQDVPRSEII